MTLEQVKRATKMQRELRIGYAEAARRVADADKESFAPPSVAPHALGRTAAASDNCEWCRREVKRGELTPIYDIAPTGERDWVCASCLAESSPTGLMSRRENND